MITDLIISFINWCDSIYSNMGLFTALSNLLLKLNEFQSHILDMQYYISGAYFIFGKPMIIYVLSIGALVFTVSLIGAIVNIVSQFIP